MKLTPQKYLNNHFQCRSSQINKQSDSKIQKIKKHSINTISPLLHIQQQKHKSEDQLIQFEQTQTKFEKQVQNKTEILYFSNQIRKIPIEKYDDVKKETVPCIITKIMAHGKITAAFDNENILWLFGMIFPQPINLSSVMKKRIIDGYLGQRGIVIKTMSKFYVINWDKIDFPKQKLKKIEINKKYASFFQCWEEIIPYKSDAWFMFSTKKQCACETFYYHVFAEKLIIYPFAQQIIIGQKIKGLSASKTHALCWTESGKIFSWGQHTLALGYSDFEDEISPRQIQAVNFEVVSAVAGTHYSIALSSQGELYEWGIKNILNEKTRTFTQEFIFAPKKLQVKLNCESQKFCCLKGFEDHFGVLTFQNNLFVWGKSIPRKLLEFKGIYQEEQNHEPFSQNNMETKRNLLFPTLCKCSQAVKIIDFQLRQDYVFLVTAPLQSNLKNSQCQKFWSRRIKHISGVIKKYKTSANDYQKSAFVVQKDGSPLHEQKSNVKSIESDIQRSTNHKFQNAPESKSSQMQNLVNKLNNKRHLYEDRITRAANQRLTKQEYFKKLKNQQKLYQSIMQGTTSKNLKSFQRNSKIPTEHYMTPKKESVNFVKFQRKSKLKTFDVRYSEDDEKSVFRTTFRSKVENAKSMQNLLQLNINPFQTLRTQLMLRDNPIDIQKKKRNDFYEKIKKNTKQFFSTGNSRQISPNSKYSSTLYKENLKKVLTKRQSLNDDFFKSALQKMQRGSIQFKKKHFEQQTVRKQRQKTQELLKNTLFQYLIKSYLIKCFTDPLAQGRETKIKVFVSNLKYNRIQKSVRKLFCTNRIKFDVHSLKIDFPKIYLKLLIIYRNYVRQWRQNKRKDLRKFCVQQVLKVQCRNKLRAGLHNLKVNVRNLQNIGSWLKISKLEKIKCLNQLWKSHLLTIFPVKPEYEKQYNVKNESMKSFKQIYVERIKNNPMLKIQNYLGVSPLFKVKMLRNCSQRYMEMILKNKQILEMEFIKHHPIHKKLNRKKKEQKERLDSQGEDQGQKFDLRFEVLNKNEYLLPYSKHSVIFQKPANFELKGSFRNGQKWAQDEKKILIEKFENFIRNFHLQYEKKILKYRRQMAIFVRDNYAKISQRRCKYILEYNALQSKKNQRHIRIKDRQLRKVLSSIGCEGILNNDILPQRHRILDEAKEIEGVPQPPSIWITFGLNQFKKLFKEYFQALQQKISNKKVKRLNSMI